MKAGTVFQWVLVVSLGSAVGVIAKQHEKLITYEVTRSIEANVAAAIVAQTVVAPAMDAKATLPGHDNISVAEVVDKGGPHAAWPVSVMSDSAHVVLVQPRSDGGPDRITMSRAFAQKVAQALVDAVGLP